MRVYWNAIVSSLYACLMLPLQMCCPRNTLALLVPGDGHAATCHGHHTNLVLTVIVVFIEEYKLWSRLGSVVGIATGYGLDGPGIESRWERDFSAPVQTGPGAHPASCTMSIGFFRGGKERLRHDTDPSYPSSAMVKKV